MRIVSSRPLSHLKRWRLEEILMRASRNRSFRRPIAAAAGEARTDMIQMRTWLEVADNSGARRISCILPVGGAVGLRAGLGDVITANVKEAAPDSNVKKGSVVKAVVVRTRKEHRRRDGTFIRFDQNAAVLINNDGEPIGTRVFGPVARELREKKFLKIVSLAPRSCKAPWDRLKRNDMVKVIAGKDRGKTGRVLSLGGDRVMVEHVQTTKKHMRANPTQNIKGGVVEREGWISRSNVMLVCPTCGPIRPRNQQLADGRRVRACRKCGNTLDQ